MDSLSEVFAKLLQLFGKLLAGGDDGANCFKKLGDASAVKLEHYYAIWRRRIQDAARDNRTLSNGWAFSTLSGMSSFESHIRATEFRDIYFNKVGAIGTTLDAVAEKLGNRNLGGVILYGYGNLFREAYFIEQARNSKLLTSQPVYLIDCSLFYHILAKSSLNPLRQAIKERQIKTRLLDYVDDPHANEACKFVRDDLNPTRPVLHLFLGNAFCNIEATALQSAMKTLVRVGDFVVAEYAQYPNNFFQDTSVDYVSEMARHAAAELFSVLPNSVSIRSVNTTSSKATEIKLTPRDAVEELVFLSMLRRRFSSTELTNGAYELVCSSLTLNNTLRLDAYERLPTNHA